MKPQHNLPLNKLPITKQNLLRVRNLLIHFHNLNIILKPISTINHDRVILLQRIQNLPLWAQDYIGALEQRIGSLGRQLATGDWSPESTGNDLARMNLDRPGPRESYQRLLSTDSLRIELPGPDGTPDHPVRIKQHDESGLIEVRGERTIRVEPHSANLVYIGTGRW